MGDGVYAQAEKILFYSRTALDGSWDGTPTNSYNIWVMNFDGSQRKALTSDSLYPINSYGWSISRDGILAAFHSYRNLDGSTNSPPPYTSVGNLTGNIWKIKTDGTGLTALTRNTVDGLRSRSATFSPDSSLIAFTSKTALDGSWDGTAALSDNLWVMGVDGSNRMPLTRNTISGASVDELFDTSVWYQNVVCP